MRCFRRRGAKRELELFSRDRLGDLVAEGLDLAIRFGEPRLPDAAVLTILNCRQQSVWSDRRRCADRGLGCVFISTRSSEPQAEGSRS
jgi:DNA-binding transcriptional LysR family regulator